MKTLPSWMRTSARPFVGSIFSRFLVLKLKKDAIKCRSIENYVDLAFNFKVAPIGFPIHPQQYRREIIELLRLLTGIRPKTVCEIGTAGGGTLFLFSRVSNPDATIISIDLGSDCNPKWRTPLYKSFATYNQKMYLIRANSHKISTLEIIKKILRGRELDFLFIDGDHTYEGVKKDYEMYGRLVRKSGMIAFYDIVFSTEVERFWNDIKVNFKHVECVDNWNQDG